MFYGEILQRQGWWSTKHATEARADQWTDTMEHALADSVNPVRQSRTRPVKQDLPPPQAPELTFDEWWPAP